MHNNFINIAGLLSIIPQHMPVGYYMFIAVISDVVLIFWVSYLYRNIITKSRELQRFKRLFSRLSALDSLTGAYNHRYFIERIRESLGYAQRKNIKFSLLKLDIELFENINKIYGTTVGDRVLKEFYDFIKEMVRSSDIVFRLADDSFGILLNFTDKKEALVLVHRIQDYLRFKFFGGKKITLYVSAGLVSFPDDSTSEVGLLSLLDRCLNKSKTNGTKVITPEDIEDAYDNRSINIYTMDDLKRRVVLLEGALGKTIIESIIAFAHAIKAKDLYTVEHTKKTVMISLSIGRRLNLKAHNLEILRYSTLLHDLGKVGIPEKILTKPGKLTKEEFEEIKKHPVIGAEILRPLHELKDIIPPILYHHERIDGTGYPYGLKDGDIPLEARIVAVADVFQALISNRVYRKAYSFKEAMEIMESEKGTHFDSHIIDVFKTVASTVFKY